MDNKPTLILASGSPRRRQLLSEMGISFEIDVPSVDESCSLIPSEAVKEISCRKAHACSARHPGSIILAADTLVSLNNTAFGKPKNIEDAFRMLRQLSGNVHQVYTGVTIISSSGSEHAETVVTNVHFLPVSDDEIRAYVASGEPMDKAGAYAIQGGAAKWIDHIDGSFTNVMGLPCERVKELLLECGIIADKVTSKNSLAE